MKEIEIKQLSFDPFDIRTHDFRVRVPESEEIFTDDDAREYIEGCDYPESVDDLLLAWEIKSHVPNLEKMHIVDAMCGPGRLGRELLNLGAKKVTFHDGHPLMIDHAQKEAFLTTQSRQRIDAVLSPVESISLPDDAVDLVVCHNSIHQLSNVGKLRETMKEFLRIVKPGGHIIIADYQRADSPEFLDLLEARLHKTKETIVPLLVPSFFAAFSKEEFVNICKSMPSVERWTVDDAQAPILTTRMKQRVNADPVAGHSMDFSPISLRVIIQKKNI